MIVDFLLQTNALYNLKIKALWGQALHGTLILIVSAIFALPYLNSPLIWAYLFLITALHIIQDYFKTKYFKGSLIPFWPFITDQLIHFSATAIIFLVPESQIKSPLLLSNFFFKLYNDGLAAYFLIGYIFAAWQGTYFIDTFRKTFLKNRRSLKDTTEKYLVSTQEKYYGIIERMIFTTFAFWGGPFYLLILPAAAFRFLFKKLRSASISILGILLSMATAVILRMASSKI